MSISVGDLIRASMRKIQVLGAGEPLPADEGADALQTFRSMVDAWTLETLLIPVVSVVSFPLVAGIAEYTIGIYPDPVPVTLPENHIETARPEKIISKYLVDSAGTSYRLKTMEATMYSLIGVKSTEARPERMYVRNGWPLNTIIFDSVPYTDDILKMETIQPLSEFLSTASLTSVIDLPPGYERALIYNLAINLADEWEGGSISSSVATIAITDKKLIKRSNYRDIVLRVDRALTDKRKGFGRYNITSDI